MKHAFFFETRHSMDEPRWKWVGGLDQTDNPDNSNKQKGTISSREQALQSCKAAGYSELCSLSQLQKTNGSCKCGWTEDNGLGYYATNASDGCEKGDCQPGWHSCDPSEGGAYCCGKVYPVDPVDPMISDELPDPGFCQKHPPACVPHPDEPKIIRCMDCGPDKATSTGIWLYREGKRIRIDDCRCPAAAKAAGVKNAYQGQICGEPLLLPKQIRPFQPKVIPRKASKAICDSTEDCQPGFQCRVGDRRCLTEATFQADQKRDGVYRDATLLTKTPIEIRLNVGSTYYIRPKKKPSTMITAYKETWVVYAERDTRALTGFTLEEDPNQTSYYRLASTDRYLDPPPYGGVHMKIPWNLIRIDYNSFHLQCKQDMSYVTYNQTLHIANGFNASKGFLSSCSLGKDTCSLSDTQHAVRTIDKLNPTIDVTRWQITGKSEGVRVKYGDVIGIHLAASSVLQGDLGTCDSVTCSVNSNVSYEGVVVGASGSSQHDPRKRWIIEGGNTGSEVKYGDTIYIRAYILITDEPYVQISNYGYLDVCDTGPCGNLSGGRVQTTVGQRGQGRILQSGQWSLVRYPEGGNPLDQYLTMQTGGHDPWTDLMLTPDVTRAIAWVLEPLDLASYINQKGTNASDCELANIWKDDQTKWYVNGGALLPNNSFRDNQIFYTSPDTKQIKTIPTGKCELRCGNEVINICAEIGGRIHDCNDPMNGDACRKAIYTQKPNPFQPTAIRSKCFHKIPEFPGDGPEGIQCNHSELFNPRSVDAAIALDSGKTDLFVGDKVYRIRFHDGGFAVDSDYPLPIKQVYPGIPDNLDTAFRMTTSIFWDGSRENIIAFFFKGDFYYTWDLQRNQPLRRFRITSTWKDIPSDLEAAWYDKTKEIIYLYKTGVCYLVYPYQILHGMYLQTDQKRIQTLVLIERSSHDKTGYDSQRAEQGKYSILSQLDASAICRLNGGILATTDVLEMMFEKGEGVLLDTQNPKLTHYEYLDGSGSDRYIYKNAEDANLACQAKGFRGLCSRKLMDTTQGHCACGWNATDVKPGYLMTKTGPSSEYATPLTEITKKPNWCGKIGWNTCGESGGAYCCNPITLLGHAGWTENTKDLTISVTRDALSFKLEECNAAPCLGRGAAWCFYDNNSDIRVAGSSENKPVSTIHPGFPAYIDTILELPTNSKYPYSRYILVGVKVYGIKDGHAIPLGDTLATFISGMPERVSRAGAFQKKVCAEQEAIQADERRLVDDYKIDTEVYRETEKAVGKANVVLVNQQDQIGLNDDALIQLKKSDHSDIRQTSISNNIFRKRNSHIFLLKVIMITMVGGLILHFIGNAPLIKTYSRIPATALLVLLILWAMYAFFFSIWKNYASHPLRWGLYGWVHDGEVSNPTSPPGATCIATEEEPVREVERDQTDGRTIPEGLPASECRSQTDCLFCKSNTFHEVLDSASGSTSRVCGKDGNVNVWKAVEESTDEDGSKSTTPGGESS